MSIEVELNNKAGKVCEQARCGAIKCPLIVRPTSEDVLTGNVFGLLRHIRPHLWLNPLLNQAIDGDPDSGRFRQVWFKDFTIQLWKRQPRFPPELLEFREGRTEPDVVIEWENAPTTLWIEAKYLSGFSAGTANSDDNDQVIRGVRTLLAETGYIHPSRLFKLRQRRPLWIALTGNSEDERITKYRSSRSLMQSLGLSAKAVTILPEAMVGSTTWFGLRDLLSLSASRSSFLERCIAGQVKAYLSFKL